MVSDAAAARAAGALIRANYIIEVDSLVESISTCITKERITQTPA
jgi:hypothetical protein